jgi:aldose 1-epimerase
MINSQPEISYQQWGEHAGCQVYLFKLQSAGGAYVELTNYGATLVSAVVPDRAGNLENVVLGYRTMADYVNDKCYLGSTIGRFANRIGEAKFSLEERVYQLQANDGINTNHGGNKGFNTRIFDYTIADDAVSFTYLSKDGEGGFPGNLTLIVAYRFNDANQLTINFNAVTDAVTIANFTNHAYFNLSAKGDGVFDHTLNVYADELLDVDSGYIPTGIVKPVGDRGFNGEAVRCKMMVNENAINGFNDCYILKNTMPAPAAMLTDPASGRQLTVYTTYPAMMFYTGDHLDCEADGNFNRPYKPFDGLCLECQYYPDSPNHEHFPSTVLNPGEEYNHTIVYKFGVAGAV